MKVVYVLFAAFLVGCSQQQDSETTEPQATELEGEKLMKDNCYSCHNTQGTDNMLAPPMFRVKDHYYDDETTKEEFVNSIVEWIENPVEENSRMPGARRKFGIMPKQNFDKEEIKAIAEYMFENEL